MESALLRLLLLMWCHLRCAQIIHNPTRECPVHCMYLTHALSSPCGNYTASNAYLNHLQLLWGWNR